MNTNIGLLVFVVLGIGVGLVLLARWARAANQGHVKGVAPFLFENFWAELRAGQVREATRSFFVGSVDDAMTAAGKVLALAVVLGVLIAVVLLMGAVFLTAR